MNLKKILKKTLLYLALAFVIIISASVLATFLYKDQLIDHFIREANKNINTPVHVDKITVSSLKNFPRVSLTFNNIYIEESFKNSGIPLLEAEKIDFTFNPLAVFQGDYTIDQIHIIKGKSHLKMNGQGEINYDIFKKVDIVQSQTVKLDLSKITLEEFTFTYTNDIKNVSLELTTDHTQANLSAVGKTYDILTDGDVQLRYLIVNNKVWTEEKQLNVQSDLKYNDLDKHLVIHPSVVQVRDSDFGVEGTYRFLDRQLVDLDIKGQNTDIQTLLSILPEASVEKYYKYQSKGNVYFDLLMAGEISHEKAPAMTVNFGLEDSELYHPDTDVKITQAALSGSLTVSDMTDFNTAVLELKNIKGKIEKNAFTGNLYFKNFETPYIKGDFDGRLDINSVFKFYKFENIESGSGTLDAHLNFEGRLKDLKEKANTSKFKTTGDINLDNLSLGLSTYPLPLRHLNGNLLFNNNDLALSDVSGNLGKSDFLLNGFFKNIIAYLLFENEPVGIESDLKSKFIDLDELLAANPQENTNAQYAFKISPRLVLKFDCNIDRLKFRRFRPTDIRGDLRVKNKVAQSDKIEFNAMGGAISMRGVVNAGYNKLVKVNTNFSLKNINIDSIFYVFENFNQTFLEAHHLKGKIFADVQSEMTFDDQLNIYPGSLTSNISTKIVGGQLNNFEPMQQLTKYLDEDKLDHLVFSELRNDIHVENKKIYLPEMEVSSNVTDIKISGTHTFDRKIDYRVVAPLRSRKKVDQDEAFGAIEKDDRGRTMLYLKIVGTTADYQVLYDKESVKEKIVSDIKKETNELKEAFKNKGKETETVELKEDDYFDWDEN